MSFCAKGSLSNLITNQLSYKCRRQRWAFIWWISRVFQATIIPLPFPWVEVSALIRQRLSVCVSGLSYRHLHLPFHCSLLSNGRDSGSSLQLSLNDLLNPLLSRELTLKNIVLLYNEINRYLWINLVNKTLWNIFLSAF